MDFIGSLWDLISELERGNRYHISVQFHNKGSNALTKLPHSHVIHATPVCDAFKNKPNGMARCLACKRLTIRKAERTRMPFSGLCINGVYEYCYPVFRNDNLCCIIYIGNILNDREAFIKKNGMRSDDPLLETMHCNMQEENCRKLAVILENYILLLLDRQPPTQTQTLNVAVAAVKEYVDYYYSQDITLTDMAKLCHYNKKYLGSLFKKELGVSFHDYLNRKRLASVKTMLEQTEETVLSIAEKSGFNNVTYLNHLFRDRYGLTPTDYRKKRKQQ